MRVHRGQPPQGGPSRVQRPKLRRSGGPGRSTGVDQLEALSRTRSLQCTQQRDVLARPIPEREGATSNEFAGAHDAQAVVRPRTADLPHNAHYDAASLPRRSDAKVVAPLSTSSEMERPRVDQSGMSVRRATPISPLAPASSPGLAPGDDSTSDGVVAESRERLGQSRRTGTVWQRRAYGEGHGPLGGPGRQTTGAGSASGRRTAG